MANYIVQDTSLETVADSIRAKAGINEKLEFPLGWKAAVDGIKGGGGSVPFCVATCYEDDGEIFETVVNVVAVVSITAEDYAA